MTLQRRLAAVMADLDGDGDLAREVYQRLRARYERGTILAEEVNDDGAESAMLVLRVAARDERGPTA